MTEAESKLQDWALTISESNGHTLGIIAEAALVVIKNAEIQRRALREIVGLTHKQLSIHKINQVAVKALNETKKNQ